MSTDRRLRIGISTCPNDTFAYHALLTGAVPSEGLELEFRLADIEELNEAMARGTLDVAKVSAHAALRLGERVRVLPVGWALGRGVGPVVLASQRTPQRSPPLVLAPGERTTATLLWRLFHPEPAHLEQRVFSAILPALQSGEADLGVCIHEARFTWREAGLQFVEDLGATWEDATDLPLPLGGLVACSDLDAHLTDRLCEAVRASIRFGHAHRDATLPTMRRHAQEGSDEVLFAHVDLYVNAWTEDLGAQGRGALSTLARLARGKGLLGEPPAAGEPCGSQPPSS